RRGGESGREEVRCKCWQKCWQIGSQTGKNWLNFCQYQQPRALIYKEILVRGRGLEPLHHCWRQDLNLVRLPISPPSRSLDGGRQSKKGGWNCPPFLACGD